MSIKPMPPSLPMLDPSSQSEPPAAITTTAAASLTPSVTADSSITAPDSAHWRRLLKRRSMQASSDVSRVLRKKQKPPLTANSQHTRRQSSQVDTLHTTTTAASPVLPAARSGSDSAAHTSTVAGPPYLGNNNNTTSSEQSAPSHPPASQSRYSVSDQSPTDLLGQRFDSLAVINSFDKISYGNPHDNQPQSQSTHHSPALGSAFEESAAHRPAHLQHSASTFSTNSARARAASRIDQALVAAGRRMEDLNARGGESGTRSPRQRYSDEARETNKLKKKSGFSSFMNNLVGTPRKPTISAPENPVHVTHVGYDQNTGEFTVCLSLLRGGMDLEDFPTSSSAYRTIAIFDDTKFIYADTY